MKRFALVCVLIGIAGGAAAQATTDTHDGSISVEREGGALTGERERTQAPLIIVSGKKLSGTAWNAGSTGTLAVTGVNSGKVQTTALNPTASAVSLTGAAAAQPAAIVRTGAVTRWVSQTQACPAYYAGQITWEAEQRQSVVAAWSPTGVTRNYVDACVAIVETRWLPATSACSAGYQGSNTWEYEEKRTGGGPWGGTGATRNYTSSCTAIVLTQWVGRSSACPSGYNGSNTWEAEQRSVANGPWQDTGATRNSASTCSAIVQTQWVGRSAACPAGQTGSNTWEAEQRSVAYGAWQDTGATRNNVNTCKAANVLKYQENASCTLFTSPTFGESLSCSGSYSGDQYSAYNAMSNRVIWVQTPDLCAGPDYYNGNYNAGRCVEKIYSMAVPSSCAAGAKFYYGTVQVWLNSGQSGGGQDADVDTQYFVAEYVCR